MRKRLMAIGLSICMMFGITGTISADELHYDENNIVVEDMDPAEEEGTQALSDSEINDADSTLDRESIAKQEQISEEGCNEVDNSLEMEEIAEKEKSGLSEDIQSDKQIALLNEEGIEIDSENVIQEESLPSEESYINHDKEVSVVPDNPEDMTILATSSKATEKTLDFYCGVYKEADTLTQITIPWDFEYFAQDANMPNGDLALASLILASDVYKWNLLTDNLATLGFGNIKPGNDADKDHGDTCGYDDINRVGYAFSSTAKKINGKMTNIIAIVCRGSKGNFFTSEDWKSNILQGGYGFRVAAEDVKKGLETYIKEQKIDTDKPTKILITGHSRGAAVANILGTTVSDIADSENVFVYTFACPNTTTDGDRDRYKNINNIVSDGDPVIGMPEMIAFNGNCKFGNTLKLFAVTKDRESDNELFKAITGGVSLEVIEKPELAAVNDYGTRIAGYNFQYHAPATYLTAMCLPIKKDTWNGDRLYDSLKSFSYTSRSIYCNSTKKTKISSVSIKESVIAYTGKAIIQDATVKAKKDGKYVVLCEGTDYTVSYKNNKNVGTATMIIEGKGLYTGTIKKQFRITQVKLSAASVKNKTAVYSGIALKPDVIVKAKAGGKTVQLKKGTDYTLSWTNNKKVGKAKVTVKGKGNFTGTKTAAFTIVPKGTSISKLSAANKAITVKWKKQAKQTDGYQIQYATNKSFTKNKKTVKVSGAKKTSKKIGSLKAGQKYYVRIRTYKMAAGVKYYSGWSTVKSTVLGKAGQTSQKPVKMQSGKTYNKYDITGDGLADKIKVIYEDYQTSSSGNSRCHFYLNGKFFQTIECARGGWAYILAPRKNLVFLVVYSGQFGADTGLLYKYKNGQFIRAYGGVIGEDVTDYTEPYSVSKNRFWVTASTGKHQAVFDFGNGARASFRIGYQISAEGKIRLISQNSKTVGNNSYKARRSFTTGAGKTGYGTDGVYVNYGDEVSITNVYFYTESPAYYDVLYQIETSNGTGWINRDSIVSASAWSALLTNK